MRRHFSGTMSLNMQYPPYMPSVTGVERCWKELAMRNILAIAALAVAISTPVAVQAQTVVRGGSVIVNDDIDGIAVDERPAFREYVVRERVPNYYMPGRVVVGAVLPETGVRYYEVPQTFGVTPYRTP